MQISLPESVCRAIVHVHTRVSGRCRVLLFGSRARGEGRERSDVDIALLGTEPLDWTEFSVLKLEAEDLAWPYRLDLVDLMRTPASFRAMVLKEAIPLDEMSHGPVFHT